MPEPTVSAARAVQPDGGEYRVMVPLANPKSEKDLISLASAIAKQKGGTVDAVHIITVPDQTALAGAAAYKDQLDAESSSLLERARKDATTLGVDVDTHTILSHRSFEEIFDAAKSHEADLVVMGWGADSHGAPGRAESALDELTEDIPCDFLVLKDRGLDASKLLVPTAGGPDSDLSAAIAKVLRAEYGSEITLLHAVDSPAEEANGRAFLEGWADDHDLSDATLRIDTTGNVEGAIETAAGESTLVIIGATERGLLTRLVRGSLVLDVVVDISCSVLLAEKARTRTLKERLFGR